MGKNNVMRLFMDYGWAYLVVLVAIAALVYYGVLSPRNLSCDSEFCRVQYDANYPHQYNVKLDRSDCFKYSDNSVLCHPDMNLSIQSEIDTYGHTIPLSFCELYISNWEVGQKDEKARDRFGNECFCLERDTPLTDAIINFSDEMLTFLPQRIPESVYESKTVLDKFIEDEVVSAKCIKSISKDEFFENERKSMQAEMKRQTKLINCDGLVIGLEYNKSVYDDVFIDCLNMMVR